MKETGYVLKLTYLPGGASSSFRGKSGLKLCTLGVVKISPNVCEGGVTTASGSPMDLPKL